MGEVNVWHQPAQGAHGRLPAQRLQIGSDKTMGDGCQPLQVHIVGQRHAPRVDVQDLTTPISVGNANGDLPVEAARTSQGRIQGVRDIGRSDYDHVAP